MQTFLEEVIDELYAKHGDGISQLTLILPSKRAGLFLKSHLATKLGQSIWTPQLLTINEFISDHSTYELADSIYQLFELYESYQEVEGESAQSFEQFAKWGQILLGDFNDINYYLLNANDVYVNLKNLKAIENWSLGEDDLTEHQEAYVNFWDKMGGYYQVFTRRLEEAGKAFVGMQYRDVAERISAIATSLDQDSICFIGFNALSTSERQIMTTLGDLGIASMYWDADQYYLKDKHQEAGDFLRQYQQKWHLPFHWEKDLLASSPKNIEVIGVPQHVGQVKAAGEILARQDKSIDLTKTAVVLADEGLLLPMLHSIPDNVHAVNVTMGYPLKHTTLNGLFVSFFALHENAQRLQRKDAPVRFYYNDVLKFLHHPYIKQFLSVEEGFNGSDQITRNILEHNKIFLTFKDLVDAVEDNALEKVMQLGQLFTPLKVHPDDILACCYLLIDLLKGHYIKKDQKRQPLALEYLYHYSKILNRLRDLLQRFPHLQSLRSFTSIFTQLTAADSLSFYGEPLRGLQVMGMLETRALDFETVIVLSANENTLPKAKQEQSFIAYDLRRYFKLPTYRERDSIFAYQFYRLMHRCKNAYFIYNTENDDFGSGEKSRYLTQILHELKGKPAINLSEKILSTPIPQRPREEFEVPKTPFVLRELDRLFEKGISPSALITYINCPLDFYYKHVLGLRDSEKVEVTVEANSFGTFVHKTLEEFFQPFANRVLQVEDVEAMFPQVEANLREQFCTMFPEEEIRFGKNYLGLKVAVQFVQRFLEQELESLKKDPDRVVTIVALERKLETELMLATKAGVKRINLRGDADRIDQVNGQTRIIDYKTGMVQQRQLKLHDLAETTSDYKYSKGFQVLTYALMYFKNYPTTTLPITSGIISFRNLSAGLMNVEINGKQEIDLKLLQDFESTLSALLDEICNPKIPFKHNPDSKWCAFCEH